MHELDRKLVSALESEDFFSVGTIGRLDEIRQAKDELRSSPLAPEWIRLLLQHAAEADAEGRRAAENLAADFVEYLEDEVSISDSLEVVIAHQALTNSFRDRCFEGFLATSNDQECSPLARSFSLSGALQLNEDKIERRYKLLATLAALSDSDDPEYLRHASRIVGLAYSFWRADGLKDSLQRLLAVRQARVEAAYELGLAAIVDGLSSEDAVEALDFFRRAIDWFDAALKVDSTRPDAQLYRSALKALVSFSTKDNVPFSVAELAEEIERCTVALSAWHEIDHSHSWFGARFAEWTSWQTLVFRLGGLSQRLDEVAWYDPPRVIEEELVGVLTASRSFSSARTSGTLETLLVPQIEAALLRNKAQLAAIDVWLDRNQEHPEFEDVLQFREHRSRRRPEGPGDSSPLEAVSERPPDSASPNSGRLTRDAPRAVSDAIADLIEIQNALSSPHVPHLLERCKQVFDGLADFAVDGGGRGFFMALHLLCLRFLISRVDLTKANAPAQEYLFDASDGQKPREARLQEDLHQFLIGNLGTSVVVEAMDVAGGRADIHVAYLGMRLVIEIKREQRDASFEELVQDYGAQSTEYQNTNLRLGFLAVLDLSDKPAGSKHLTELVHEELVERQGESEPRGLVVLKIPGNRKTPSRLRL